MSTSNIEWTEFTWNPVTGCNKVSAGCKNCYAETIAYRFWDDGSFTDIKFHPERMMQPIKMKKPKMIFVNSMSDLFHAKINPANLKDIFNVMNVCKWHTFQVLTKRASYMRTMISLYDLSISDNIWLGVSVENNRAACDRIGILGDVRAKTKWLSVEPLLEDVDLLGLKNINWVVVGCESGPKRRECKIEWVEDVVDQCRRANVPVFVKQLQINGKVTKDIKSFPDHLQIREYPNA